MNSNFIICTSLVHQAINSSSNSNCRSIAKPCRLGIQNMKHSLPGDATMSNSEVLIFFHASRKKVLKP
jgi:hypothetical protein